MDYNNYKAAITKHSSMLLTEYFKNSLVWPHLVQLLRSDGWYSYTPAISKIISTLGLKYNFPTAQRQFFWTLYMWLFHCKITNNLNFFNYHFQTFEDINICFFMFKYLFTRSSANTLPTHPILRTPSFKMLSFKRAELTFVSPKKPAGEQLILFQNQTSSLFAPDPWVWPKFSFLLSDLPERPNYPTVCWQYLGTFLQWRQLNSSSDVPLESCPSHAAADAPRSLQIPYWLCGLMSLLLVAYSFWKPSSENYLSVTGIVWSTNWEPKIQGVNMFLE